MQTAPVSYPVHTSSTSYTIGRPLFNLCAFVSTGTFLLQASTQRELVLVTVPGLESTPQTHPHPRRVNTPTVTALMHFVFSVLSHVLMRLIFELREVFALYVRAIK